MFLAALLAAPLAAEPVISVPVRGEWPLALAESLYRDAKAPLPSPLWPDDWVAAAYVNDMGEPSCPGVFDADGLNGKPDAVVQRGVQVDGAAGDVVYFLPCSIPGRVFKFSVFRFPLANGPKLSCRGVDADAVICRVEMQSKPAGAPGDEGLRRSYHYFGLGKRLGASKP